MSPDELLQLAREQTMTGAPTAAEVLHVGLNKFYEMVRDGSCPVRVIRAGRLIKVPTADLLRAVGLAPSDTAPPDVAEVRHEIPTWPDSWEPPPPLDYPAHRAEGP
jgi:hypothetical protein